MQCQIMTHVFNKIKSVLEAVFFRLVGQGCPLWGKDL